MRMRRVLQSVALLLLLAANSAGARRLQVQGLQRDGAVRSGHLRGLRQANATQPSNYTSNYTASPMLPSPMVPLPPQGPSYPWLPPYPGPPLPRTTLPTAPIAQTTVDDDVLAAAINRYRTAQGLSAIPLSSSLANVASLHTADLSLGQQQQPLPQACNPHSWYLTPNRCCYDGTIATASCMWDKPSQLTSYRASGYEIIAFGSLSSRLDSSAMANAAIQMWATSEGHIAVILNRAPWQAWRWQALGCSMRPLMNSNGRPPSWWVASCWFGNQADPVA